MKYLHIITVGVSIIENFKRVGGVENRPVGDNEFWKEMLDDPRFLSDIYKFVSQDPKKNSAELNSFLSVVEKDKNARHEVYFVGTKTPINEICVRTLEKFMRKHGYEVYIPGEVSGYFLEEARFSHEYAVNEFVRDISILIDKLIYITKKKKAEGYRVIFNPTGGLKAHVIACAVAGFLTNCPVYYIHEEFKDVIQLPPLFYIPKGREIEVLKHLKDKKIISGSEFERFKLEYPEEIERLEAYQFVEIYSDEVNTNKMRITDKGLLILEEIKEV